MKIIVADWNNTVPAIDFMKALQLMPNVAVKISSIPLSHHAIFPILG
ncbi:hypothetical protein N4G58_01840 [Edwardsiella piscicida]|nr:hypothetical protein N4G58_01840 [Edwardsiella piscicida]